ncbi:hypothetical protein [Brucella cytisi]|uniref:Uncharacterized protein n=1 Tax=Brucella cytisi TaxID=407152 RepID=A0A1J6HFE9_9HYPH|nr:hypothetical protein [Brucella cytisi]OIS91693.1 hypothetical protein BLA27_19885 [Brucella cytisi]
MAIAISVCEEMRDVRLMFLSCIGCPFILRRIDFRRTQCAGYVIQPPQISKQEVRHWFMGTQNGETADCDMVFTSVRHSSDAPTRETSIKCSIFSGRCALGFGSAISWND